MAHPTFSACASSDFKLLVTFFNSSSRSPDLLESGGSSEGRPGRSGREAKRREDKGGRGRKRRERWRERDRKKEKRTKNKSKLRKWRKHR